MQLDVERQPKRTKNKPVNRFHWFITTNSARQVVRGMLYRATPQKCSAALLQSLRKVELGSISCNACSNKNVARLGDWRLC